MSHTSIQQVSPVANLTRLQAEVKMKFLHIGSLRIQLCLCQNCVHAGGVHLFCMVLNFCQLSISILQLHGWQF